MKDLCD